MVDTLRSWPEYRELLEILREKVVDVDRIIELFRELYWRGNVLMTGNVSGIPCFCTRMPKIS